MCKWSDPFSKRVLIGRGLDHNSLEYLKSTRSSSDYSVLKARPSSQDSIESLGKQHLLRNAIQLLLPTIWKAGLQRNTRQSKSEMIYLASHMVGDDDGEVPPVPIPNTVVKLTRAQDS